MIVTEKYKGNDLTYSVKSPSTPEKLSLLTFNIARTL
jgi:hypothetical protein